MFLCFRSTKIKTNSVVKVKASESGISAPDVEEQKHVRRESQRRAGAVSRGTRQGRIRRRCALVWSAWRDRSGGPRRRIEGCAVPTAISGMVEGRGERAWV